MSELLHANQNENAPFPSTPLTQGPTVLPSSADFSNPMDYEAVRTATSMLCEEILRQPVGLARREAEKIRERMRALGRLEIVLRDDSEVSTNEATTPFSTSRNGMSVGANVVGKEKVHRMFAKALRDGYVLCQLLNKVRPGSIPHIDAHEDGVHRRSNVEKFLASCSANGLGPEGLFEPDDLVEVTSHGLARVARTVISLIKWAEVSSSTHSHSLSDGGSVDPEKLRPSRRSRSLRKRPRITTGAIDPLLLQPLVRSAHVAAQELSPSDLPRSHSCPPSHKRPPDTNAPGDPPFMLSADGAIAHSTGDQPILPSIKNQSTSPSTNNESAKGSFTQNESTGPSTEFFPLAMNQFTTNESLTNRSRFSAESRLSHPTNNQSRETSSESMHCLPIRTRLLSLPEGIRLLSSPTRARLLSLPTRVRLLALPTRTRLLSLPARTRLPPLPSRARLLSLPTRTQLTVPPWERITGSTEISLPTKDISIPSALGKKSLVTQSTKDKASHVPQTKEDIPELLQVNPDHLDTCGYASVDATFSERLSSSRAECILIDHGVLSSVQWSDVGCTWHQRKG